MKPNLENTFSSFATIETNLTTQIYARIDTVVKITNYKKLNTILNKYLADWKQYQQEADSFDSKQRTLQDQLKNELNAELKAELDTVREKKNYWRRKVPSQINVENYINQLKVLNLEKTNEAINNIIKAANKEIDQIQISNQVLRTFRNIIKDNALPVPILSLLYKEHNKKRKSKNLSVDILDRLAIPENYSLPKEIWELVQSKLKDFERPQSQQEENEGPKPLKEIHLLHEEPKPTLSDKYQEKKTADLVIDKIPLANTNSVPKTSKTPLSDFFTPIPNNSDKECIPINYEGGDNIKKIKPHKFAHCVTKP